MTLLDVSIHSINFLANLAVSFFSSELNSIPFFSPRYVSDLHYLGPVGPNALCLKHNTIVGGVWDGRGRSHLRSQETE